MLPFVELSLKVDDLKVYVYNLSSSFMNESTRIIVYIAQVQIQ